MSGVFRPNQEFFTHMETSPLPVKSCKFWLCSALMAIEQWGFFSVPHLLWHGASVYNGLLRGPMTLSPIAERFTVELSLTVFTTPDLPHTRQMLYLYATTIVSWRTYSPLLHAVIIYMKMMSVVQLSAKIVFLFCFS